MDPRDTINQWISQARVPTWLRSGWDRWKEDREYVSRKLFEQEVGALVVNLPARILQTKLAKIMPTDSDLSVKAARTVDAIEWQRRDAMREYAQQVQAEGLTIDPKALIAEADEAENDARLEQEGRERFAQTVEVLCKTLFDEADGNDKITRACLSAMTVGVAWIKVLWTEDASSDAAARDDIDDLADLQSRHDHLLARLESGDINEGSPEFTDLEHLQRLLAKANANGSGGLDPDANALTPMGADERTGTTAPEGWDPVPQRESRIAIDLPRPENMRWDWRVGLDRISEAEWIAEQVLMDLDEVCARYRLSVEERERLESGIAQQKTATSRDPSVFGPSTGHAPDPDGVNDESATQRGKIVVWERWDRPLRRHTIFVEGLDRFLVDEEVAAGPAWFFPYECLVFNDQDGANVPPSDIRFLRHVCDAINQRLTDGQQSLWSSMKRYLVKRGAFREGELEKLRGSRPHDVIEADDPDAIKNSFVEIASDDWNPAKYALDDLFRLLELVMGMSLSELGVVNNAKFATEAQISNEQSQTNAGRHAAVLSRVLTRIMRGIAIYAIGGLDHDTVRLICGKASLWPLPATREALMRQTHIRVVAAGSTTQAQSDQAKSLKEAIASIGAIIDLRMRAMQAGMEMDVQPLLGAAFRLTPNLESQVREVVKVNALPPPQPPEQAAPATA